MKALIVTVGLILGSFVALQTSEQESVYICTSPKAYAYHKNEDCKFLKRCSYEIKAISIEDAKRKGYKPCKSCTK